MSLADRFFTVLGMVLVTLFSIVGVIVAGYVISGILSIIPDLVWSMIAGFVLIHLLKKYKLF